jgi:hypothetical protein
MSSPLSCAQGQVSGACMFSCTGLYVQQIGSKEVFRYLLTRFSQGIKNSGIYLSGEPLESVGFVGSEDLHLVQVKFTDGRVHVIGSLYLVFCLQRASVENR